MDHGHENVKERIDQRKEVHKVICEFVRYSAFQRILVTLFTALQF